MGSTGNPARLQIEAFFIRFAHGKGLARQGSITHDRTEKIMFGNRRQIEAYIALLTTESGHGFFTMDVVNARF